MYKLLNMADFYSNEELEKDMKYFSEKYGFDGYELIKFLSSDKLLLRLYPSISIFPISSKLSN